jgi:hypothetical protein
MAGLVTQKGFDQLTKAEVRKCMAEIGMDADCQDYWTQTSGNVYARYGPLIDGSNFTGASYGTPLRVSTERCGEVRLSTSDLV